jgi:fructose-bisphosphate aldolase class I
MILAGSESDNKINGDEVAKLTVECLKKFSPI